MDIVKLIILGFLLPFFAVLLLCLFIVSTIITFISEKVDKLFDNLYSDFIL